MTDLTVAELGDGGDAVPELYRSGRAKQRRSLAYRLAAYAAGISALVGVVLFADRDKVADKFLDVERAKAMFPELVTVATKNTIIYTVLAFVGGAVLGLVMALLRLSSIRAYRWFSAVYIEIFRGLPALLTIFLVGFITPIALGIKFPKVLGVSSAGIFALSLVAGAYLAETIRAGIQAVPRGQVEAARSLGMTHAQTLRKVVVPQAVRIIIPSLTNELVLLIKDTSLLATLGVTISEKEITKFSRDAANTGFNGTPLLMGGLMYLVITIPLTRLVAWQERRNMASR